jgi:hypothetical protein
MDDQTDLVSAQIEHVSLQVKAPPLTHLTNTELNNLRTFLHKQGREARKAANKVIMKEANLKALLLKTLSYKHDDPARIVASAAFESELARNPEALTRYAIANAYVALDSSVREEVLKRASVTPAHVSRRR